MSLLTPNDAYLKGRRALIVVSGLVLLSVFVGIVPESGKESITFLSFRLTSPDSVPFVFFVILLYSIWQYWSSWFVQTDEVRRFIVNRIDVVVTLIIAFSAASSFLVPLVLRAIPKQDNRDTISAVSTALSIVVAILGFFASNSAIRDRFKALLKVKNATLSNTITNGSWILIFNPKVPDGSKEITFQADGHVGRGRNDNETTWRIKEGTLEIINSDGKIFSRFRYDKKKNRFEHTNDEDTLSIRDQVIESSAKPEPLR